MFNNEQFSQKSVWVRGPTWGCLRRDVTVWGLSKVEVQGYSVLSRTFTFKPFLCLWRLKRCTSHNSFLCFIYLNTYIQRENNPDHTRTELLPFWVKVLPELPGNYITSDPPNPPPPSASGNRSEWALLFTRLSGSHSNGHLQKHTKNQDRQFDTVWLQDGAAVHRTNRFHHQFRPESFRRSEAARGLQRDQKHWSS